MRFAISQSELNTFRTCRQKWKLKYLDGLVPVRRSDALRTGSLFHTAMECLYGRLHTATLNEVLAACADVIAQATIADESFDAFWAAMDVNDMRGQVYDMVERYATHFFELDALHFAEVIGVEYAFETPVRWLKEDGQRIGTVPGARYIGAVDVVLRERDSQQIVVMEHKTTGGDASEFDARFDVDPQTPGYVWAVRESRMNTARITMQNRQFLEGNHGRVILNAIRRTGPKEPGVNKDGSVSAAACDTTRQVYEAALVKAGKPLTAKHHERLASLPTTTDKWICRHEWRYSQAEVERWLEELRTDAALLRQSRLGKVAPTRNGSACSGQHQPKCDMRDPCVNGIDGSTSGPDPLYTIRDTSFAARTSRVMGGA